MGRLRDAVLSSFVLCVHTEGVLVSVWFVRWQVYNLKRCSWAVRQRQFMVGLFVLLWVPWLASFEALPDLDSFLRVISIG